MKNNLYYFPDFICTHEVMCVHRRYAPVLILIFKFTSQNFPFLIGLMQALWNRSLRTFITKYPRARYEASFTHVK